MRNYKSEDVPILYYFCNFVTNFAMSEDVLPCIN